MNAGWWRASYTGQTVNRLSRAFRATASTSATQRWWQHLRRTIKGHTPEVGGIILAGCLAMCGAMALVRPEPWTVQDLIVRGLVLLGAGGLMWRWLKDRRQIMGHAHHGHDMQHQIADEWKAYWRNQPCIPSWDYTSELVMETLRKACGPFAGRQILEAGCGTGRISLQLAREGAQTTCIDISHEAVGQTHRIFSEAHLPLRNAVASLFTLPFASETFDVVWNAGVLEHFSQLERCKALTELLRVTKPGGLVVTLNPYRFAVLYRVGKFVSEKLGKWPYGHEAPIATLVPASRGLACTPLQEYSIGFYIVLVESLRANPHWGSLVEQLRALCVKLHRGALGGAIRASDRLFSRLFGGYLLVSGFRKQSAALREASDRGTRQPGLLSAAEDGSTASHDLTATSRQRVTP